ATPVSGRLQVNAAAVFERVAKTYKSGPFGGAGVLALQGVSLSVNPNRSVIRSRMTRGISKRVTRDAERRRATPSWVGRPVFRSLARSRERGLLAGADERDPDRRAAVLGWLRHTRRLCDRRGGLRRRDHGLGGSRRMHSRCHRGLSGSGGDSDRRRRGHGGGP